MMSPVLVELTVQFLVLSLLSIGGANAIIPEMHRRAVDIEHWMTDADFAQMFALSQAAPGPNVLIVSLIVFEKLFGFVGLFLSFPFLFVAGRIRGDFREEDGARQSTEPSAAEPPKADPPAGPADALQPGG